MAPVRTRSFSLGMNKDGPNWQPAVRFAVRERVSSRDLFVGRVRQTRRGARDTSLVRH